MSDPDLLARYARDGDSAAFRALVERHVDLVYAVARRLVRDDAAAKDVAQAVFIELARGARQIKPGTPVVAWLHLVSRRTALNVLRGEIRRRARESAATQLQTMHPPSPAWSEVEPLLDEAVESLDETDRSAILLRFFEHKSLREVGAALGTSDDAAQKRVSRALEELRAFLLRRGVAITAAGLATDLSAHAIALGAAPAGLGATISGAALAAGAGVGASAVALETSRFVAMTAFQKTLAVAALIVLGGAGVHQALRAARQSDETAALLAHHARATAEQRDLRAAQADAVAKLEDVEHRIDARMAAAIPSGAGDAALESQMRQWLAQMDRMQDFLARHPEWNIPELKLLPANDWFNAAATDRFETEEQFREATSQLRNSAIGRVANRMREALSGYVRAHDGLLPNAAAELAPYFNPPIDPAILARYEMLRTGKAADVPRSQTTQILAPQPADVEYDAYYYVGLTGYGNNGVAMHENLREAQRRYGKANEGKRAATAAELLPYLRWPASAATVEKYFRP